MHQNYLPLRNAIVDQELVKSLDNPVLFCDLALHSVFDMQTDYKKQCK